MPLATLADFLRNLQLIYAFLISFAYYLLRMWLCGVMIWRRISPRPSGSVGEEETYLVRLRRRVGIPAVFFCSKRTGGYTTAFIVLTQKVKDENSQDDARNDLFLSRQPVHREQGGPS